MCYILVPPLALGGMEGDTDDLVDTGRTSGDSFFDNKVPLNGKLYLLKNVDIPKIMPLCV